MQFNVDVKTCVEICNRRLIDNLRLVFIWPSFCMCLRARAAIASSRATEWVVYALLNFNFFILYSHTHTQANCSQCNRNVCMEEASICVKQRAKKKKRQRTNQSHCTTLSSNVICYLSASESNRPFCFCVRRIKMWK